MSDIKWCIDYLKKYNNINENINLKDDLALRALMNITMPYDLSDEFYLKQDKILKELSFSKGIVDVNKLDEIKDHICLYLGDIVKIKADAIVNACNSRLLGCLKPLHYCIDNAIHSFAGLEVRRDLLNELKGKKEPNGKCRVTKGYNLPSKYIFHTVGPIYSNIKQNEIDLRNCYYSCLKKADEMKLKSIVFCSLSTGVFGYPINKASSIAIDTVIKYLNEENKNIERVVFNLFKEDDYNIYLNKIKNIK